MPTLAAALQAIQLADTAADPMPSTRRTELDAPLTAPAMTEKETARIDPHAAVTETMKRRD